MIRENKWKILVSTAAVLLPMLVGLVLWDRLPERMPVHWGTTGEVDGWSGRPFAVFAIPGFMTAVHLLCVIGISLDPKAKGQTRKVLGLVFWICPFMSLVVGALTYAAALGIDLGVMSLINASVGVLIIAIGNYLPKCRHNYTIGIKVMWALEDEANWNATHRFAGKVWVAGGIVLTASALLPTSWGIWLVLAVPMVISALSVGYSYVYYVRHKKSTKA